MRIILATDAWKPQVNGVVRTWGYVCEELALEGHTVKPIHPGLFKTIGAPRYQEIRLAILPGLSIRKHLEKNGKPDFDAIHIATEGPIGQAARKYCLKRKIPFTTSYHTQFPQYFNRYFGLPEKWMYNFVNRFHGAGEKTLVPTKTVGAELIEHGFPGDQIVTWCRGVDTRKFVPGRNGFFEERELPRPIFLYAGRVALEKNIEAFLELDLPGSKVVVGDGPPRAGLEKKYADAGKNVVFTGYLFDKDLVRAYADADVFVFPSKTDTFGVVMLEANACGLPVAAYPVTGPIDVVVEGTNGSLDEDLAAACMRALEIDRDGCVAHANELTWAKVAMMVHDNLVPI